MSKLLKFLQQICEEEGVSFKDFLNKIKGKNPPKRVQSGDLFGESEP